MIARYSATITKHGYTITNCEYFTVSLVEIPLIQVSRSTRQMTHTFFGPKRPITKVYFKGQQMFNEIKYLSSLNLPIFIKGEYVKIDLPFAYAPRIRDLRGKLVSLEAIRFDPNTGSYKPMKVTISHITMFIDRCNIMNKDILIQKEIKKQEKYKI